MSKQGKETIVDVWSDGSFRDKDQVVGAGWMIRQNGVITEGTKRIDKLPRDARGHGSDYAEILAIRCALNDIPSGASVQWRMDAQNIMDWVDARKITTPKKLVIPSLVKLFDDAVERMKELTAIKLIKVGGRNNAELDRVNSLARAASSPEKGPRV